ncbi:alanine racemase [Candidatus Peregrinibacteria bacterium]|nr:alanine racemase [Candidatus Peregrinibacteria bacterium]
MFLSLSKFRRKLKTLNRVEILAENILHNFETYKKLLPEKHLFPCLKSNAYGHGITEIVTILKNLDFPYFVVDSYYEALEIQKLTKKKTLIIGYNHPENYQYFDFKKIAISVYDLASLKALASLKKRIKIHLMVNTGMNREGILLAQIQPLLEVIAHHDFLELEGVFSHFADADDPENSYTDFQMQKFHECLNLLEAKGFCPKYVHFGNSAGVLKIYDERINSYRLGIGLYGYCPLFSDDALYAKLQNLKPALRVVSTVVHTQFLSKGEKVGYNCTFEAQNDMTLGVIPAGYYECIPRSLSNTGFLKIREHFVPIIGRVCMNLTCFDEQNTNAKVGDEIVVISEKKEDANSIEHIAKACGTIPYEILVKISESIRRKVVSD